MTNAVVGKHDNILCAIQKNEPDELGKPGRHPYYMIRLSTDEVTGTYKYIKS